MRSQASCLIVVSLVLAGCTQEMMNQRRVESQEATVAFADGAASRPLPAHTVSASRSARANVAVNQRQPSRQWLDQKDEADEEGYLSGRIDGKLVNAIPQRVVRSLGYRQLIERGRERFNISCVPCHDLTGSGNGMVARRGLKFPPSYHTDRLRSQPLGYIFNVATLGRGQMPAYGDYLSTDDRWAISAYVRTLQFSQYVAVSELAAEDMRELERQSGDRLAVETSVPNVLATSATGARQSVQKDLATSDTGARQSGEQSAIDRTATPTAERRATLRDGEGQAP